MQREKSADSVKSSCDRLLSTLTYVVPRAVAAVALRLLQGQDFEGGQRCGAGLGGDHPSEPGHRPRPDVVVVSAD